MFSGMFASRHRLRALGLLSAFAALTPSRAFAAGGGGGEGDSVIAVALLGIGVSYLLANFVIDKLQQRFLMLTGVEYVMLGMLLWNFGVIKDIDYLMPAIGLAAGWVGLLRGMDVHLDSVSERPEGTLRISFLHHFVPGALVGFAAYYVFPFLGVDGVTWRERAAVSLMLACCAAADSAAPIDVVAKRYEIEGPLSERLRAAARLGDVLVILAFGFAFTVFHAPPGEATGMDMTWAAEWTALQLGMGVVLGLIFVTFLGGNETPSGRFTAMVGIIAFASGAAFFLGLSSLAVNVCLGIVLVNVARTGKVMVETLQSTERPFLLILLVLAGILWRPPPLEPTVGLFGGFVLLRLAGKYIASRMAAFGQEGMRRDLFRGLLAHGEVTVAMAVSFQVVFDGVFVDVAYTVVLASVVVYDLTSPRVLRGLLVDAGDVRRERSQAGVSA